MLETFGTYITTDFPLFIKITDKCLDEGLFLLSRKCIYSCKCFSDTVGNSFETNEYKISLDIFLFFLQL